jgi:hypothetical protein
VTELCAVQKEQRARQLNEGTFERRIHQGIDKGKGLNEQGELFGAHNLFKFDPSGTVSKNVSLCQKSSFETYMSA